MKWYERLNPFVNYAPAAFKSDLPPGDPVQGGPLAPWDVAPYSWQPTAGPINYARAVGDTSMSSAVMACVRWIMRNFPEAPPQVLRTQADTTAPVPDHPLLQLLTVPNPAYSGLLLWSATLFSLNINGNGYWIKWRNSARSRVVQLWWEPHFTIRPVAGKDKTTFIDHYELYRNHEWIPFPSADVVHFRDGLDPDNPRLGLSPLASAMREIFTDQEAAAFTANLLRNMAVPGIVISPSGDNTIDDPDNIKQLYMSKFSGDHRGEPLVLTGGVQIEKMSFTPTELNLREVRFIPEERIAALLGLPPGVAGLGAGLARNTFSNYAEAREAAYENNIIPTQRLLAAELDTQLLPDLGNPTNERVGFDLSQVRVLQDDQNRLYTRMAAGYDSGFIKRSEARQATGWPVTPDDDQYKATPSGSPPGMPQVAPTRDGNQKAARNGHTTETEVFVNGL
jgi:HK97 family phage portal protein